MLTPVKKPILCLDFDGVIHSYTSGWKGARSIPDPPVPGALEFIVEALEHFTVAIYSTRSHRLFGRHAMRRWLLRQFIELAGDGYDDCPGWWRDVISETAFADPWRDEARWAALRIVKQIQWPSHKPAAMVTIDDRALTFNGCWWPMEQLLRFQPWTKTGPEFADAFNEAVHGERLYRLTRK